MVMHQHEMLPQFDKMICPRVNESEPAARPEHPRRLGEILRREDADYQIECRIVHRPAGPQISHGKRKAWPASRRQTRCGGRSIESETDHRKAEVRRDAREVMAGSGAGIEDTPGSVGRQRDGLSQVPPDRRRDEVEMTCFEECRSMRQLIEPVAAFRRAPTVARQQVDIALTREIEAVAVTTDERARRGAEAKPTDRTAQQTMTRAG